MTLPDHLGGHAGYTNDDVGVLSRLIDRYHPKTFLDIGCGPGGMLKAAKDRGIEALGIDGDYTLSFGDLNVLVHDFTTGPAFLGDSRFDLGWSVEFLEHVDKQYLPFIKPAFRRCSRVWITHALPGQIGWHHVNCQKPDYWVRVFSSWGFRLDRGFSRLLRQSSTMEGPYSRKTGMLFERIR